GAVSTANLLTAGCGASPGRAKADLDAAHALYTSTVETSALVPTCRPGPLAGMAGMLEDGTIRLAHVDTAVRALDRIPEHFLRARENDPDAGPDTTVDNDLAGADDEVSKVLVGFFATHAPTMSPRKMAELSDELLRQIAPPTDDLFDPDAFNRRDLAISTDLAGMVHGRYQLDANAGGLFAAIIDALSGPLPQTSDDTGEVTVRDPRKPGQRRADALTEIIRLAAARLQIHTAPTTEDTAAANTDPKSTDGNNPDDAPNLGLFDLPERAGKATGTSRAGRLRPGRRAPRIVIVTTEDQVRARRRDRDTRTPRPGTNPRTSPGTSPGQEPPDGPECRYGPDDPSRSFSPGLGLVDAGMVARTACDAVFERIILDANGAILDLGTGVRLATPAQRRALEARDKGCTFPGCNRPASWCDAHHVIWFSRGGPTSIDNMALLCPAHHSLIHTGQWTMTMIDGIPYARPAPGGRTPAIYGTAVSPDGWIRNTYFDALNHAKHTAATIRHLATG
ncbi:HNH endonuclease signature motif containing protein, partial [Spelaeicoccus albus]